VFRLAALKRAIPETMGSMFLAGFKR